MSLKIESVALMVGLFLLLNSCGQRPKVHSDEVAFLEDYASISGTYSNDCSGPFCLEAHLESSDFILASELKNNALECEGITERRESLDQSIQFTIRLQASKEAEDAQPTSGDELKGPKLSKENFKLLGQSQADCLFMYEVPMHGIAPHRQFLVRFSYPDNNDIKLQVSHPELGSSELTFDLSEPLPTIEIKCS